MELSSKPETTDGIENPLDREKFELDKQKRRDDYIAKMKALDNDMKKHKDQMESKKVDQSIARIKKKNILQSFEIKEPLVIDYENESTEDIVKRIEFAIEQLEKLAIEGEEFEFWISGISRNKKYRKKIDYLLAQLKHSLRVKKFGLLATSEFRKFSEACDLIIFPYRTGWKVQASGILMRALEGGACVLTSDSPGPFDEAIQDNAVASFRWEHPEEFKNKVRWLLHSRDQRLYFREKSNQFLSKRHANELVTSKINQALETSN